MILKHCHFILKREKKLNKNTQKKKKQARVFMSLNKPIMGHKSETEEGGLTLTGPNPKSNHTSPSLPLTDPGRVSFTAHVTST